VGVLSRVSTPLAAWAVERLISTPPRPRRSRGRTVLAAARPFRRWVDGRPLAAWLWGEGPAVLLVHGWGGQAAEMTSFVTPLLERGLSVVAFDGPGHGPSGRGLSSAPELARALRIVAEAVPPVHGIVAHSLGATATALAMRSGLRASRVALVAPMMDPVGRLGDLMVHLRLPEAVRAAARRRSERRIRAAWDDLRAARLIGSVKVPALVAHDRDDAEVPHREGESIARALTGATFVETAGLGHNRIVRDPAVVDKVVAFLAEGAVDACRCGAPRRVGPSCEGCHLEWDLFDRDARWSSPRAVTA